MRHAEHKVAPHAEDRDVALRRQSSAFGLTKVDDEGDIGLLQCRQSQDAHAPRLDQAANRRRGRGDEIIARNVQIGPVVRNQIRAQGDQVQGKRGFPAARGPEDQKAPPFDRDATGMQRLGPGRVQTGSPTTKRAPSGSDVMSAWVGRMFSAQITPPWASMICFEIARPRPEWLPKSDFGRSE